jgi:hypothetical protein
MNLLENYVTNITNVETGLPYNSVRITADFEDDGGKEVQATKIISMLQYTMIRAVGYYWS